ncbi:MAG: PspC domain-containing protein [Chloroflexota bacterium]
MNEQRLSRSEDDKFIAGVCAGISDYVNIDPVIVRGLFVILLFASGIGFPIYLILWFIMPSESNATRSGTDILSDNFEDMGNTVSDSVGQIGNPSTVGIVFIMLGGFFLLSELGILASGFFWPVLVIGLGIFLLVRRSR